MFAWADDAGVAEAVEAHDFACREAVAAGDIVDGVAADDDVGALACGSGGGFRFGFGGDGGIVVGFSGGGFW